MRCWLADWWIRDDKPTAEVVSCSAAAVPAAKTVSLRRYNERPAGARRTVAGTRS